MQAGPEPLPEVPLAVRARSSNDLGSGWEPWAQLVLVPPVGLVQSLNDLESDPGTLAAREERAPSAERVALVVQLVEQEQPESWPEVLWDSHLAIESPGQGAAL